MNTKALVALVALAGTTTSSPIASARGVARQTTACERLAELRLPNTTIATAERITSGSFTPPNAPNPIASLPPFCRVAGSIAPTSDSQIKFEAWLPLDNWNGKFAGVGNGGWAGTISFAGLAEQLRRGYAGASTDTGHEGNAGDAQFAYGHPERLIDFAYRSVHETTTKAKAIVETFYGKPPGRSYWIGCSSGGYQGLMEAQRFPADYDGIVAGAPANNWTRLMAGDFDATLATFKDPASELRAQALALLNRAAVSACDADDGVTDGVITDPRKCRFDPGVLRCNTGQDPGTCLTGPQIETARRVYAGLKDPVTGTPVYPGLSVGSEPGWPNRNPAQPFGIPVSHFRWVVFANPNWDWRTFSFTNPADYQAFLASEAKVGPIMNATNPDLSAFRKRGGKLLQYHGWNDQLIAAENSIDYYERVAAFFGRGQANASARLQDLQNFYRLYMIPGYAHCGGGPGAATFDLQTALEQWIERGVALDAPLSTRTVNGVVERSRPLCPYPAVATYDSRGNPNDAASFACRAASAP